jgi:multidrug efflux pump subunit AcrA (membrane-fusion protein)
MGDTGTVYRVAGDNSVEELQVRLGARIAGTVTILSGIAPGNRLAAGNLAQLKDGARIWPLP